MTKHPLRALAETLIRIRELHQPVARSQYENLDCQRPNETAKTSQELAVTAIELKNFEVDDFLFFDSTKQLRQVGKTPASHDIFKVTRKKSGQEVDCFL